MLDIHQFPCLPRNSNYGFIVREPESGLVAAIDSPDPDVITAELDKRGWTLDLILNTHHHWDHVDGNPALVERYGCAVVGPSHEAAKIKCITQQVSGGDAFQFGAATAQILHVPGHTLGHIIYYFAEHGLAFVGDCIFAMGCGRLFEGTPQQMHASLQSIMALPDDTVLYCAHEYTQANAKFALTVEPGNAALQRRTAEVAQLRADDQPTVPTTVALEKATNPFVRTQSPEIRAAVGRSDAADAEVFGEVRRRKDRF